MSKMKRRRIREKVSLLLACIMLLQSTAPLVVHAAEYIENLPRYVDFSSPDPITPEDLSVASPSDVNSNQDALLPADRAPGSDDSHARAPERYYDHLPEEPDGILVHFQDDGRVYLMEEN